MGLPRRIATSPPASPRMSNVIECRGLAKTFQEGKQALQILKGVDLVIAAGEQVAIMGASGSGKSTLLQLLGGLDEPTAGSIAIDGQPLACLSARALGSLRNRALGFSISSITC